MRGGMGGGGGGGGDQREKGFGGGGGGGGAMGVFKEDLKELREVHDGQNADSIRLSSYIY